MQKILRRRIFRNFKTSFSRYFALFGLIILGMYIIVGMVGGAENVITSVAEGQARNRLEDGMFTTFLPLEEAAVGELKAQGLTVEEMFYLEYILENESTLRLYKNREQINRLDISAGRQAEKPGEVVLEKQYATSHELEIGDTVILGSTSLTVTGIASTPDYDNVLMELSSAAADGQVFGTAFVCQEQYERLNEAGESSKSEEYAYSYLLNDQMTDEELKSYLKALEFDDSGVTDIYFREMVDTYMEQKEELQEGISELVRGGTKLSEGLEELAEHNEELTEAVQEAADGSAELQEGLEQLEQEVEELTGDLFDYEIDNLVQFVKAEDNPRISASAEDELINKYSGILAGIIVMVLFTYVISVFVVNGIEKELAVIGAFYALGVRRGTLVRHYLTLPVLITAAGGILGSLLGFSPLGTGYFAQDAVNYFSIPEVQSGYPLYLILYGVVMPPVTAGIVNYIVINRKLKQPVLRLMRKEPKEQKIRQVNVKRMGYIRTFQMRQFLREYRSGMTIMAGMFISLLILMLGLNCYAITNNMQQQNKADISYEYMYSYKYPTEAVPERGMGAYLKSLNKEAYGYNLDVTLLGIEAENSYFDFEVAAAKNMVTVSTSAATKFNLKEGDKLILTDEVESQDYAFTVAEIVPYSIGLHVFMDIDSMRELFGVDDTYYNVVYAEEDLAVESGRLYATTSRSDVEKASEVFIQQMMPMVYMMTGIAILIFMIVMYLMLKVVIDRSAGNISMMKVFGYRKKEIKRLYLDGNFIWIILSSVLCIPLSKLTMDQLYPMLVSNVSIGMDLTLSWQMYAGVAAGVIICYLVINQMLMRRVNHFLAADILKERE